MDKAIESSYIPLDIAAAVLEQGNIINGGESCRVDALKNRFAWMRGFVAGIYGWANDGKGTFIDFMSVLKAKKDNWKFAVFKGEDMDSVLENGKIKIKANRIYKNLAWSLTGQTWNESYARQNNLKAMTLEEELEALEFISKHFYVIYPSDRKYKNILEQFLFLYEKYGIDAFLIDNWGMMELPDGRGDERLIKALIDCKDFALRTNSCLTIINNPKNQEGGERVNSKDPNSAYKVVNQFMQLGGSGWDQKLDIQYSLYRDERHLDPNSPKVSLYNLKTKQMEVVGIYRGETKGIIFSPHRKQYYFDGINPMDGTPLVQITGNPFVTKQAVVDFSAPTNPDEVPF